MKINRADELAPYDAPNHFGMRCLRVQGHDASPAASAWIGMSRMAPGARAALSASPVEKMYFVLSGEVTLCNEHERHVLRRHDSCYVHAGEARELLNHTDQDAAVLLVMPYR